VIRCLVDGKPADTIPLDDRGLQYGDGLFETLAVQSGKVLFAERHLARLAEGCKRLGFPAVDRQQIRQEFDALAADAPTGVLKLTLTRGSSQRGYAADNDAVVRRILCLSDFPLWPGDPANRGIRARLCCTQLALQPQLAGLKHLNRLEQVLARREWQDEAIREGLLCDTQEHVIEGTMSNLFCVIDGVLRTPRLDHCGVAGVMRSVIIDLAGEADIPVEIGTLSRQDIRQAEELFVCNSLIGLWPIISIDTLGEYPVGALTRYLQARLHDHDDRNNTRWYAT